MLAEHVINRTERFDRSLVDTIFPDRTVKATFLFLLASGIALVICHVAAGVVNKLSPNEATAILRDFFGLEREGSLVTWFSSFQLTLMAIVSGLAFVLEQNAPFKRRDRFGWLGFSLVFLFLSADETAEVHERLDQLVSVFLAPEAYTAGEIAKSTGGPADYFYLLLYIPALIAVTVCLMRFFSRRAGNRTTQYLLLAGLIGFYLKLAFEPIEAWAEGVTWLGHKLLFEIVILQMYSLLLGETLIVIAVLSYLMTLIPFPPNPIRSARVG